MPVKFSEFISFSGGSESPCQNKKAKKKRFLTELTVFSTTIVKRGNERADLNLLAFHFWELHVVIFGFVLVFVFCFT